MLGLSILVKPPKKQIIFNNAMNIYFVEKYKNLDLWYTNNDYSVFRKDYFKDTNYSKLPYINDKNNNVTIHDTNLFF